MTSSLPEPVDGRRLRLTSRILLFDRSGRILLMYTLGDNGLARWLTPGGGVDPGETHLDAAVRELEEETGLTDVTLGDVVYRLDFAATFGALDHDLGHAEYYRAVVDRFVPSAAHWTADEQHDVLGHRWFTAEELEATGDAFEPPDLVALVREHAPRSDEDRA
ncbi:NUDIX domain-containing protein [Galbitalea sp. SE-J8]|uniref:NUDIX hydrolase n=1 Tax=Galbitalea sp. SE-J8 TaxID=3054952 RepID=UPI00259D201C|nr:NUDIX domain-containing protein [Galbitalea sp. SE-J8]MDM4764004.1 NUDIX domain-containing protein [Galbitalea sp. SE-J8]